MTKPTTFLTTLLTLLLLPTTHAASRQFFLRSISSHAAFNGIPFGGVANLNGILVGGLQPSQTLPVAGSIDSGVLSLFADGTDPGPAYFIHGSDASWIQLNVFGTPQSGYSLDASNVLTLSDGGGFYGELEMLY